MDDSDSRTRDPLRAFRGADLAWLSLALVWTAAVFWRSLAGEFVYDDLLLIQRNPGLADLSNVPTLFTQPYWDFLAPGESGLVGYWRPLSAVVHAVAWSIDDGLPKAFHGACVTAHLFATAAAFLLARRLTSSAWVAGFTALLFGLHPTHVESVAWISALNDPLFGAFTLFGLVFFLRWRERGSRGFPIGAALCFFLSLLAKEMGIAFLPLAVAIDVLRRRPSDADPAFLAPLRDWQRAYAPFGIALAIYIALRMAVFESLLAGFDRSPTHFGVDWARLALLRIELLGGALHLLAWPDALNAFRPFRPELAWGHADVLISIGAIAASLVLLAVTLRKRWNDATLAIAFIPLGFAPVLINVGSLGRFPLSDRFLYIPVIGVALLLAIGLRRLLPRPAAMAALVVIAGLFSVKSWNRIDVWRDEETLFVNAVEESPRSAYLRWGLGRVYLDKVSSTLDEKYLQSALATFEGAGALLAEAKTPSGTDLFVTSNDYMQTNLGLGLCYVFEAEIDDYGSYETAIAILDDLVRRIGELRDRSREARSLGIRVVDSHLELELVYSALGSAYTLSGQYVEAETALRNAVTLNDRCIEAHMGMGRLFGKRQIWNVAIHHFERALELQPGDYETKLALAQVLRESGNKTRAAALALELVEQDGSRPHSMMILAGNALEVRDAQEALVWIDRAIEADETHAHAWYFKAMALDMLGVNETATITSFRRSIELLPDHFEANYNFGNFLLRRGASTAAAPYLVDAYRLTDDPGILAGLLTVLLTVPFETGAPLLELALIDGRRGRNDLAESWLDRSLQLSPDHPDALFQKGRVLVTQNRHEEALDYMQRALELEPASLGFHREFGQYLESRGRLVDAQRHIARCLELIPEEWDAEMTASARKQIADMLDRLREKMPPSNLIGPPAPPDSTGSPGSAGSSG